MILPELSLGSERQVACELAPLGIRVNAVAPGGTVTPMTNALGDNTPETTAKMIAETSPLGFSNFANTNVQFMGERLFVGYDAGRPVEVDPETLQFLTPVGSNDEWLQSMPGALEPMIAVGAHPGPDWDEEALYFAELALKYAPQNPVALRILRQAQAW